MLLPSNRISFARAIAAELAALDRISSARISLLAAHAVWLIRDRGISPEFARRHVRAYALNLAKRREATRGV